MPPSDPVIESPTISAGTIVSSTWFVARSIFAMPPLFAPIRAQTTHPENTNFVTLCGTAIGVRVAVVTAGRSVQTPASDAVGEADGPTATADGATEDRMGPGTEKRRAAPTDTAPTTTAEIRATTTSQTSIGRSRKDRAPFAIVSRPPRTRSTADSSVRRRARSWIDGQRSGAGT